MKKKKLKCISKEFKLYLIKCTLALELCVQSIFAHIMMIWPHQNAAKQYRISSDVYYIIWIHCRNMSILRCNEHLHGDAMIQYISPCIAIIVFHILHKIYIYIKFRITYIFQYIFQYVSPMELWRTWISIDKIGLWRKCILNMSSVKHYGDVIGESWCLKSPAKRLIHSSSHNLFITMMSCEC